MRTHIVLWKWDGGFEGDRRYTYQHVNAMVAMIKENTKTMPHPVRIVCVTDDPGGITQDCDTHPLWNDCDGLVNAAGKNLPSCYRRLKLYDPETQRAMDIEPGDRILSLDLDTVICGDLRQILETPGQFVGWKMAGTYQPEVFNGSFQMFTAGDLAEIWTEFDPLKSPQAARQAGFLGSDQSWLSWRLIKSGQNIEYPVLASYPLHCRRMSLFSARTRLVFFHGRLKPWSVEAQADSPWIRRYWKG
jgi:hypothetical protein